MDTKRAEPLSVAQAQEAELALDRAELGGPSFWGDILWPHRDLIRSLLTKAAEGYVMYPPFKMERTCVCDGSGTFYGGVDGNVPFNCGCKASEGEPLKESE